jgi:diadenosine tetraphosphate (Ap4A) HIT family hydrolase
MRCIYCYPDEGLIIKSMKNFHVVIDPYPICVGHMMIVSKEHYGCTGELPPHLLEECNDILSAISGYLEKNFDNAVCFEHGRAGVCAHDQDGSACSHMHLHVLPAQVDITHELCRCLSHGKVEGLDQLRKYFHGFGEYMYFQARTQKNCYFLNNRTIPSHFMRTIIAEARGEAHLSDWEQYQDKERIDKNFAFRQKMRSYLENDLPR